MPSTSQAREAAGSRQHQSAHSASHTDSQASSSSDARELFDLGEPEEEDEWEEADYEDELFAEGEEGEAEGEGQWGRYLREDELIGDDIFDAMLDDLDPDFGDMLMPAPDFDAPSPDDFVFDLGEQMTGGRAHGRGTTEQWQGCSMSSG